MEKPYGKDQVLIGEQEGEYRFRSLVADAER